MMNIYNETYHINKRVIISISNIASIINLTLPTSDNIYIYIYIYYNLIHIIQYNNNISNNAMYLFEGYSNYVNICKLRTTSDQLSRASNVIRMFCQLVEHIGHV